ncbi:MAG: hypothetical protein H6707_12065 [Deltaproteobacteria bacterium]|nr:hypothetical protein [Deltaproteobacteria bacterium]
MDSQATLSELEALAKKLDVAVVYDQFTGEGLNGGGLCRVRNQWRVIVERRSSATEKVSVIARALARFDIDRSELSPDAHRLLFGTLPDAAEQFDPAGDHDHDNDVTTEHDLSEIQATDQEATAVTPVPEPMASYPIDNDATAITPMSEVLEDATDTVAADFDAALGENLDTDLQDITAEHTTAIDEPLLDMTSDVVEEDLHLEDDDPTTEHDIEPR